MIIGELHDAIRKRTPVAMATVVASQRSVPRRPGSKMLVYADGHISGSIGGGEMEARVVEEARTSLETGSTRRLSFDLLDPTEGDPGLCGGSVEIYVEPHLPQTTLLVVGGDAAGGDVADALVTLAEWVGYRGVLGVPADADEHSVTLAVHDAGVGTPYGEIPARASPEGTALAVLTVLVEAQRSSS
jgi:xanthine dehydrogenase accessory factor